MNQNTTEKPLVVLTTGGTGGHVFPAEALAKILQQDGRVRLALITDKRGETWRGALNNVDTYFVKAAGVTGHGLTRALSSLGQLAIGTVQAWLILKRLKPSVVVGFGGYASLPATFAAVNSGITVAIHEQNAVLGRTNRILAHSANLIATSFKQVKNVPEKIPVVETGMPVRPEIVSVRNMPYPERGPGDDFHILVLGGSQGARYLSTAIPQAIISLPEEIRKRVIMTQQCRAEDLENVREIYRSHGVRAELATFFDNVPNLLKQTHLVITRSGASTVAEMTTAGRPAIFIPYPQSADDHQTANARAIAEAGGGWLMPQGELSPEVLAKRLETLCNDPHQLAEAAQAAREQGRPLSAQVLAEAILTLAFNPETEFHS